MTAPPMSGDGFRLQSHGLQNVSQSLRDDADLIARAGSALAGLSDWLTEPAAGEHLAVTVDDFAAAWTSVLDDLLLSLAELATWVDRAVFDYITVDTDASYRFGAVR